MQRGFTVDRNERFDIQGTWTVGSKPEETWFNASDFSRTKATGGTIVELHLNPTNVLMPERNVPNEAWFATWMDKYAQWGVDYGLDVILDIGGFSATAGAIADLPNWLYEGYPEPVNYWAAIRDFFDLHVSQQDANRQAFINLWTYIANRYKGNPHVLFSIMNEPVVEPSADDGNIWLGQSYSTFMESIVDGIRSMGAQNTVLINRPYFYDSVWNWTGQPVNRDIVWEDHAYVGSVYGSFDTWKATINSYVQRYIVEFGKPLFIGEYGIDPSALIRTLYVDNWRQIIADQTAYLEGFNLFGRQFHTWGMLNGEIYATLGSRDYWADLTVEESDYIVNTVLNEPVPKTLPFGDDFTNLQNWMPINGAWTT